MPATTVAPVRCHACNGEPPWGGLGPDVCPACGSVYATCSGCGEPLTREDVEGGYCPGCDLDFEGEVTDG